MTKNLTDPSNSAQNFKANCQRQAGVLVNQYKCGKITTEQLNKAILKTPVEQQDTIRVWVDQYFIQVRIPRKTSLPQKPRWKR